MRKAWAAAVAVLALFLSAACCAEVENIADQCRFWVSQGSASAIGDSSFGSAWTPSGEAEMRVMLPDSGAAWIQLNWSLPPTSYTLTEYDANQAELSTRTTTEEENFGCLSQLIPVSAGVKYISVKFNQSGQGINKVRVFPEGELPKTVVQWEKPCEKCDLMVISTHQDDEWLWFGAIIPYYDLVRDKDVQVVYMANCGRYRYQEALNGIAVSGVKTYPHFIGLQDKYDKNLEEAVKTWTSKEYIIGTVAEVIRRYKPEVILTHDWDGEYGHPQHRLTSRCMEYAIEAAADPNQYPESAQKYGAWQVKKLYRHLEEKGRIEFDWHVAYDEFGGRTGIQVATDSMNEHASQLGAYQVEDHGKYDNALFGLSYSVIGDDVEHKDLFENIEEAAPEATAEALPDSSVEGELAPMEAVDQNPGDTTGAEVPADEAGAQPEGEAGGASEVDPADPTAVEPEPEPVKEGKGSAAPMLIVGAGTIAAAGIGFLAYTNARAKRRRRRRRRPLPPSNRPPQNRPPQNRPPQGHPPQRRSQEGRSPQRRPQAARPPQRPGAPASPRPRSGGGAAGHMLPR